MVDFVIYGRIIIDEIHLKNGEVHRNLLGGGAPQAAFGARIWTKSVGILVRSGYDIPKEAEETMNLLDIDTSGWVKFEDLSTTKAIPIKYDQNENRIVDLSSDTKVKNFYNRFENFHNRVIPIPDEYQKPKAIHFLSDLPEEPMIEIIRGLSKGGAILSFEPMIDYRSGRKIDQMVDLIKLSDLVTPDWKSACFISQKNKPIDVLKYWVEMISSNKTKLIAIRDGRNGSYVWEKSSDLMWHVPTLEVSPIDTTGCGNSYGGGLCVGWCIFEDPCIAAACATASAISLISSVGIPPISNKLVNYGIKIRDEILKKVKKL